MNKVLSIPKFHDLSDLYNKYKGPVTHFIFESHLYQYAGAQIKSDIKVHIYKCKAEQHFLNIHVNKKGKVLHAPGIYVIRQ